MKKYKFNLKRHWYSRKDYAYHKSFVQKFGAAQLPEQLLFISPILDQDAEDCTAFSACAARASEKNKNYDPIAYWAEECQFDGQPTTQDGTAMRTQLETGIEKGFIPLGQSLPIDKASAYFTIVQNGGMDMFDSIRTAILNSNYPLTAGITWYADWLNTQQGVVPNLSTKVMGGHAIKIAGWKTINTAITGWKTINNVPYIVVQNSWGTGVGDNGLFYFSRELANVVFNNGSVFIWSDSQNPTIQKLGLLGALEQNLINLLQIVKNGIKQIFNI